MATKNYQYDKEFLARYLNIIELHNGQQKLLLAPGLQGRVLTSTANGEQGYSFGWLNYNLIASGKQLPHCNNWGGEDRFWLGPEGGQFSLFFKKGTNFTFEEWQTPALIDTEAWELKHHSTKTASFCKEKILENCSGTQLSCHLEREVILEDKPESLPEGIECVSFKTVNHLTNTGDFEWTKETGMPSIWMLGQFIPSEDNTIIIPYRPSDKAVINDRYFGKIGDERLKDTGKALLFKADGKKRGKIGIPPAMVVPVAGAYDASNGTLTIVRFSIPDQPGTYVNSMWEYQHEPFQGDVLNAYNDGPLEDGSIMGPFYELESSSPAAALKPGETLTHLHTTTHYMGNAQGLDQLAKEILGIGLEEICL